MTLVVLKDADEAAERAADEFVRIAKTSIDERGEFNVALSGGSTPKKLYKELLDADVDWAKVRFYFGDERNVPADDAQSNFKLANDGLFQPLGIDLQNVYRWKTELGDPETVAADYAGRIGDVRFDLILLGMGPDAHTASLFPYTSALKETARSAVENWVEKLNIWRFTLTFPAINSARNVVFMVAGKDKAEAMHSVLKGEFRPDEFPSQGVIPIDGDLQWFVDEAAASRLKYPNV